MKLHEGIDKPTFNVVRSLSFCCFDLQRQATSGRCYAKKCITTSEVVMPVDDGEMMNLLDRLRSHADYVKIG